MKILTIIDGFPPEHSGGSEHVALNLSRGLQAEGHEVVVLTTTQRLVNQGESSHDGLRVIRIFSVFRNQFLRSYLGVYNPIIRESFIRVIRHEHPDIIHFHNIHNHISYAAFAWARKNSQAKIFFTAHDVISFAYSRLTHFIDPKNPVKIESPNYRMNFFQLWSQAGRTYNPFRRTIIRHYLNNVNKIFTVSEALAQAFTQNGITNVRTLYNGIDISRLEASEDLIKKFKEQNDLVGKKIVLFAGRPMSAKGLLPLLNCLPLIIPRIPEVFLAIAIPPNGPYAEHVQNIIVTNKLSRHAGIIGLHRGYEWAAMFRSADVVVVPSIYFDPAPLVTMEAMSAGKPVVGTCFGGTPEIVKDGVTGFIINPYDGNTMAKKIGDLLADDSLAKMFGDRGFERIKSNFTVQYQVENTLAYYKDIK